MSISLQLRGAGSLVVPLPTRCLANIEKLRAAEADAVATLFGDGRAQAGETRTVGRGPLAAAATRLLAAAARLGGGFELRCVMPYGGGFPTVCRGLGGAMIGGVHHCIDCREDYWFISPQQPGSRESARPRYHPEDVQTENMGVVQVRMRRSSPLAGPLREVQRFAERDDAEAFEVTWG